MDITSYLLGKQAGGGGGQPSLQSKSITITENGTQNVTADSGYDGLSSVSVTTNVSGGGGLDWSVIGYSGEPQAIEDGYNYAVEIMNNWTPATSLSYKFYNDKKLMFMPLVDTSTTTNMQSMFENCYSLIEIGILNTSSVTKMKDMFKSCYSLEEIPLIDTSQVTSFEGFMNSCQKIKKIPKLNTVSVTTMKQAFYGCANLESVSLLNTENVTDFSGMFNGCSQLKTIPQFDISNATNLSGMFTSCSELKNLPLLNAEKVTNFSNMFFGCRSLTDETLDNILQMCINAVSYTGTKTLVQLGFNSTWANVYPVSRIQALPHYQDFLNAGWTIGY